jgi:predicted nucleic acid-binding protein
MILVDSNVLIDVVSRDSTWFDWSYAQLLRAPFSDMFVNAAVVAEVAPRFESLERFLFHMSAILVRVEPLDVEGGYRAGLAFQLYRDQRRPGQSKQVLADFLIGGHAEAVGASILTRDARFYRRYFSSVPLISPE